MFLFGQNLKNNKRKAFKRCIKKKKKKSPGPGEVTCTFIQIRTLTAQLICLKCPRSATHEQETVLAGLTAVAGLRRQAGTAWLTVPNWELVWSLGVSSRMTTSLESPKARSTQDTRLWLARTASVLWTTSWDEDSTPDWWCADQDFFGEAASAVSV